MTVLPERRIVRSINGLPYAQECRPVRSIMARSAMASLFLDDKSKAGADAYLRVLEAFVPVGLHATFESNFDGSDYEKGQDIISVQETCHTQNACDGCLFSLGHEALNGVEPGSVLRALARATTIIDRPRRSPVNG